MQPVMLAEESQGGKNVYRAFFDYLLGWEDLENCLDVMGRDITPENLEKLKDSIMENDKCSRLEEKLTETAFNFIYDEIERLFPAD